MVVCFTVPYLLLLACCMAVDFSFSYLSHFWQVWFWEKRRSRSCSCSRFAEGFLRTYYSSISVFVYFYIQFSTVFSFVCLPPSILLIPPPSVLLRLCFSLCGSLFFFLFPLHCVFSGGLELDLAGYAYDYVFFEVP